MGIFLGCGHGSVVERVLAKHETGFRLPLAAQRISNDSELT